jgi:hypothetical protein
MAFAYSTAVAGVGTVSCAGTTTVTGSGTTFAIGFGGAAGTNQARVGGTITVGGVTKTIVAIASATSLTVDTAFGTFTGQAFTVQTEIIQTGTDTMNLSLGAATGISITNRADLYRIFDVRGCDFTINGTLTVDSTVAQLRNDGSCTNRFTVNGSVSGGEIIINGRRATANNGPFPYVGFDWLGQNGQKIIKLASTNASFPAKFTMIDSAIRFGADWLTTDSGNFSRITTQGDECWILCARGTGTSQARLRQDNTTSSIDFQTTKETWVGVWLNFGVPQLSLKGYTPIGTDGPEINLASVPVASLITIDNYNTTYVQPSYYPGVQIILLGSAWTRLKNNLLGTNIAWRSSSSSGGRHNVIEFSKQITSRVQDTAGNLLSDGYMYYQPVGSNVAGVRGKGMTADITFDLSQQNIATVAGAATSEFPFAWGFTTATTNLSTYNYFCTGQTKGAETHLVGSSRYGYDKQYITVGLAGNNDVTPTYVHTSLPTSDKVIATAAAISGIAFNFTTKVMTITGNLTYQQIYDAYQYALNQTANLFQADNCLTANSTSNYVGWTINVATGVTLSTGSGNFSTLKANTITLTGTAIINGIYQDSTGTSTILKLENISPDASVCVWNTSTGATEFFQVNNTATAQDYFIYYPPGNAGTTKNVARELYGIKRYDEVITLAGGEMWWTATDQEDVGITDTKTVASAYTTLSTTSQIYDATAIFRLTETGIKLGQLVARDGLYLDFGTYNVKIKDDASAIVAVASGTITYKSIVINETSKYNAMKATPPKTITPNDNELINVLIEDANGDSLIIIKGGLAPFNIYKFNINTTDFPLGIIPDTRTDVSNFVESTSERNYRFIADPDYNYFVYSPSIRSDSNIPVNYEDQTDWDVLLKGIYSAPLFKGDEIIIKEAPEITQINNKMDELIVKTDTNLDVKVSTRLAAVDYVEPHNTEIDAIKAKTDTLVNTDLTGIATGVNVSDAKTEILTAIDDIPTTDISLLALESTSQSIKTKTDTLENYDDTTTQTKLDAIQDTVDNISVDFTPVLNAVDALPTLSEIEATTVLAKKTDVTNAKDQIIAEIEAIPVVDVEGMKADLVIINENVKKASKIIPAKQNLTT